MATWKCIVCTWDNSDKWQKCAKCGAIRVPITTSTEAELFKRLQAEVRTIKAEIDRYNESVARKWEYLQISSDDISNLGGLENFGSKGWELVAITSYSEGGGMTISGVGSTHYTVKFMYIFKRPIDNIPDELIAKFQAVLDRTPGQLRNALRSVEHF